MYKKLIAVICIITLMVVASVNVFATDTYKRPSVWLFDAIWDTVELNGLTGYVLTVNDADTISLTADDIILNGFDAKVSIMNFNATKKLILLSDIQGITGNKTISIKAGIATNKNGMSLAIINSRPFYLDGLNLYVKGPAECSEGDIIEIEVTADAVFDWIPNENDFLGLIDNALEFQEVTVNKGKCTIKAKANHVCDLSLIFSNGGENSNCYNLKINSKDN